MARALEREADQLVKNFECSYDVQSGQDAVTPGKQQLDDRVRILIHIQGHPNT